MKQSLNKIEAWHKIEYLKIYEIDETKFNSEIAGNEVAASSFAKREEDLPWLYPDTFDLIETDEWTYNHTVFVGVFKVKQVQQIIRNLFTDKPTNVQGDLSEGRTAYAQIRVNHRGDFIPDSCKISTVPFALGKLQEGALYENWYGEFQSIEKEIGLAITQIFRNKVAVNSLHLLLDVLTEKFGWTASFLSEPYWIYSSKVTRKKQEVTEEVNEQPSGNIDILNSFILRDLELVRQEVAQGTEGRGLHHYLNGEEILHAGSRIDLEKQPAHLSAASAPSQIPLGKWPSGYHLNLMQQAAVNQIMSRLGNDSGLFSVNGPPGTGKTTLLRDVIAAIIVERACKMVHFDNPEKAFVKIKNIGPSVINRLDNSLTGYGVIVASSNNGAVENISLELPDEKAIPQSYRSHPGSQYLQRVAKTVYGESSWGMISARLGNSTNRYKFNKSFWFTKETGDYSFKRWLYEVRDTRKMKKNPLESWNKAKNDFLLALETVQNQQAEAIKIFNTLKELSLQKEAMHAQQIQHKELARQRQQIWEELQLQESALERYKESIAECNEVAVALDKVRFGLWERLWKYKQYKAHLSQHREVHLMLSEQLQDQIKCKRSCEELKQSFNIRESHLQDSNAKMNKLQSRIDELRKIIDEDKVNTGREVMNEAFWDLSHDDKQKSTPWMTKEWASARELLFLEALHLHEQFLAAAQPKIMGSFFEFVNLHKLIHTEEPEVIRAIWDIFTLAVPVVSTAFASVQTMLRGLGKEAFGWLFVDEAGQAVPQDAVGAIWRSQKIVVVGDPKQIEPVVTLPESIFSDLQQHYNVNAAYVSSKASVQTIADTANSHGTWLQDSWIGSPLWVHRRCDNPMFNISNEIAYDNRMVLDKQPPSSEILKAFEKLGESRWIDISGEAASKQYVPQQGMEIMRIVREAFAITSAQNAAAKLPNLFVITPFTAVRQNLIELLRQHYPEITGGIISKSVFIKWLHRSIGTVHTFQGKEANVVVLCLGADFTKKPAVQWATEEPNLLNVAVSRAKHRLFVVGDKQLWMQYSNADVLLNKLSTVNSTITG